MIDRGPLSQALHDGDLDRVRSLVAGGADLHYRDPNGYDALIDAVHGRDVKTDSGLLSLLQFLIDEGVALDGVTSYQESGLRVLSRLARFDAVGLLLRAGAPREHLQWTPLMEAVAMATLEEVEARIGVGDLEAVDWWSRTAWLIAVAGGDIPKAELLRDRGANTEACGRCAAPPMSVAVESRDPAMVRWMIGQGKSVDQVDQFGGTALAAATEMNDLESMRALLGAGASVETGRHPGEVLNGARTPDAIRILLAAGADIQHLSFEGRRAMLGLPPEPSESLLRVTRPEFDRGRTRRFGRANPERMREPYWEAMIRAGVTAYTGEVAMGERPRYDKRAPGWCAQRFGQSITFLPDGRIVQVAGEHEDSYDPDFCIYNDVFVHDPDGAIVIYAYPEADFPPTDFHTATQIGSFIYLVGSLGYQGARRFGETQVMRLDTRSWRVDRMSTRGEMPGWIYKHRAKASSDREIVVEGGTIATLESEVERHDDNHDAFVLDVERCTWRRA